MPLPGRKSAPEPLPHADDWRPQRFGAGARRDRDVIIEPGWSGIRVLARLENGRTRFIDEEGADCTDEFAEVSAAITAAALAGDLILDGHLTVEPTQVIVGVPPAGLQTPTAGSMAAQMLVGDRIVRPVGPKRRLDPDRPIAFVAVDLLRIDGSDLLDVPLLERKRLLDGALAPADLVRITPYVSPPAGSFLSTWRGMGFLTLAYKGANSRYRPGTCSDDWSIVRLPAAR
jgi:ATP-dependent DNA ligase